MDTRSQVFDPYALQGPMKNPHTHSGQLASYWSSGFVLHVYSKHFLSPCSCARLWPRLQGWFGIMRSDVPWGWGKRAWAPVKLQVPRALPVDPSSLNASPPHPVTSGASKLDLVLMRSAKILLLYVRALHGKSNGSGFSFLFSVSFMGRQRILLSS